MLYQTTKTLLCNNAVIRQAVRANLLASRGPSDWDSYRLQFTGKWLVTTSHALLHAIGHVVSNQWNTAMYVLASPLSLLSNWKKDSMRFACNIQAAIITPQDSHIPLMTSDYPHLAVDRVQNGQGFSTVRFFSRWIPGYSSSQNQKVSVTLLGGIVFRGRVA